MASNISAAWSRHGDQRSLDERWAEATARLLKLPGGKISSVKSEVGLDELTREIKRLSPVVSPDDPVWKAARRELFDVMAAYATLTHGIRELQRVLERVRNSPVHLA